MYNPNLNRIKPLTYEKFVQENIRWNNLTPEQQKAEYDALCGERDRKLKESKKNKEVERARRDEEFIRQSYISNYDPNSPTKSEAIILWLIAMIVGSIFNARFFIWIVVSVLLFLYLTRESRRAAQWDNGGKDKYYKNLEEINKRTGKK